MSVIFPQHTHLGTHRHAVSCSLHLRGRSAHCELKKRMTECQRETGVVNGLLVAGASWLRVNGSILERRAEQGKASEPSMSRDWGRWREEKSV